MGNAARRQRLGGPKTVLRSVPPPKTVVRRTALKCPPEYGTFNKYDRIADNFRSIEEVTIALKKEGLESSNLIVGIDFTKSNEWTGKDSFNYRCLHTIGDKPNPYEQAIAIIGKTLAPFDEDNLIPCFGFGDASTRDQAVFSFHNDHSPCHGFGEVLDCYRSIAPKLQLSGPTSFAPIVDAAVDIVEKSGGQFHVLLILADGQITRSNDLAIPLSKQQEKTIESIVTASYYPLAIVLIGVGDGPWDGMKEFDDEMPKRSFDNFQFVNFTAIMKNTRIEAKEAAFALAALMEIPFQYRACLEFGILGCSLGKAKKVVPRPPPLHSRYQPSPSSINLPESNVCPICFNNVKNLALDCGHVTCQECGMHLTSCPICRKIISSSFRLYSG